MAKRISEATEAVVGGEPLFSQDKVLSGGELTVALNWYNSMRESKDAKRFLVEALKAAELDKRVIAAFSDISDADCRTIGFVARMISRGAKLTEIDQNQFENGLTGLVAAAESVAEEKQSAPKKQESSQENDTPVVSVQDRIRAQASKVIGELEAELDNKGAVSNTKTILVESGVKGPQGKLILEWVETTRKSFLTIQRSKDAQIKEGYSNYSKKDWKNIMSWLDECESSVNAVIAAKKAARKPRKRKEQPITKVVGAVKYLKADANLKATSIDPTQIVGALQLWVFNTKTRKLGVFNASDASGLTVKGTTVKGFDESKSFAKTLRKPESKVPELVAAGKVALRKFMDEIKAKESTLKGRLNEDTLLLKVVK
jgi:hypothetical protein